MIYCISLLIILLFLVHEKRKLAKARARLTVRVHVHGSRGKSGITAQAAALLRARGWRILAKTTGDRPEIILPDGSVAPVRRFGPPRIKEHITILQEAARLGADAVLLEGMALERENIWFSEQIIQASHAVIANTRPDHAETMGSGRAGVLASLSLLIPRGQCLITGEEAGSDELAVAAAALRSRCVPVASPLLEQPQAIADALCRETDAYLRENGKIPAGALLPGSPALQENPFPHARTFFHQGAAYPFLDFFSANDLESSQLLWRHYCQNSPNNLASRDVAGRIPVALLAGRADRPLRTKAFADWLATEKDFKVLILTGSHAPYAWLRARRGRSAAKILLCPWHSPQKTLEKLLLAWPELRGRALLAAFGNSHGPGQTWRAAFSEQKPERSC